MSMMDGLNESVKFLSDKFDSIGRKVDALEENMNQSISII